jgi:Ca2+-binding EF-hand superfamily protein
MIMRLFQSTLNLLQIVIYTLFLLINFCESNLLEDVPTKKITKKSLIEATFITADKNKNFQLDLVEFHGFVVVDLEKINCHLKNSKDSQKIMDLFDANKDGQLNMDEFKDFLL